MLRKLISAQKAQGDMHELQPQQYKIIVERIVVKSRINDDTINFSSGYFNEAARKDVSIKFKFDHFIIQKNYRGLIAKFEKLTAFPWIFIFKKLRMVLLV